VGTGDSHGVAIAQIVSSCMGGVRTAGDLVAWMQLTRKMKIDAAKAYVADKLDLKVGDLTDETVMARARAAKGIGSVIPDHIEYTGIAAKTKIAKLLEITIHSVDLYQQHLNA
jgi:dimethylamine--corrinoid protein Co-methyltransferase